jgi:hypothetical protein
VHIKKRGNERGLRRGESLGVSFRQAQRTWSRFRARGDAGLVHRSLGKPAPLFDPAIDCLGPVGMRSRRSQNRMSFSLKVGTFV